MISIGFVVGCICAGIFLIAGGAATGAGLYMRRHDDDWLIAFIPGVLCVLVTAGLTAWGMFPYDMQYHRYKHVAGTVDNVQTRLLADGDSGTTQNFAVRLREAGDIYRCDDTRCSLLKPGDHLELWCIREWQYAATSGWVCKFDKTTPGGGS